MSNREIERFSEGDGRPDGLNILLIHGSGSAARPMARLGRLLAGALPGAEAVAVSLAGYGSRSADESQPVIHRHMDVLMHVLGDARWHLVGHSMGGYLALQIARRVPKQLASLSLIEPMAFGVLEVDADQDALDFDRRVIRAFSIGRERGEGIRHFIEAWNQSPWEELPDALRSRLEALEPLIYEEANAVSFDQTPFSAYQSLAVPILLLAGRMSPLPAKRIVERLSVLEPADLRWIEGAGHMGVLRQPEQFAGPITEHIRAC